MPEENVVVSATFKLEDYSLSIPTEVVVKKDEIDLTNETILHYNDQISITYTTLAEGYYVTEFEVVGATQISENLYRVTGDVSISFAKDNHYTVTLSVANDLNYGTLDKSNVSVEYGAQVSFYAGILGIGDPSYILIGDTIVYPTTHTNTAQWVYFIEGYDIDGEYFSDHFVGMSKTTNVYDEMEIVVYFGREFQQYYVGISCNSAYGSLSSELDSNVSETGAKVQWGDFIEFDYTTNSISFYSVSEAQDLTFIIEPKESGSIEYDYVFKGWQIIVDTEVVEENPTSWRVEGEVDIVAIFETVYKPCRASFSVVVLGEEDSPFVGNFLYGYSVDNPQMGDHFSTIGGIDLTCNATFRFIEILYVENDTILISGSTNYSGGLVISALPYETDEFTFRFLGYRVEGTSEYITSEYTFDNPDTTISFEVVYEKVAKA